MRIIQISTPFGKDLEFLEFKGTEGLSQLFEYNLTLTSKNPNLDPKAIIGQTSTIQIQTKYDILRYLNGLVTDFGYLHEDPDEEEYHLYTCTLRPLMWYLTQKYDSRVFVDKTVLDIAQTILGELGVPVQVKCQNSYRKYGHSTQYQESSFSYLSRLFEQEGIYYYFEHADGSHNLIILDNKSPHKSILGKGTLPYHSKYSNAGTPDQAYIDSWEQTDHLTTSMVNVNDYNYNDAKVKIYAKAPTHELNSTTTEDYNFYTNFKTSGEAEHYKQMRAEDYKAQSKRIHATSNALTIAPGFTFTLDRHPHNAANVEQLIVSASYHLNEAGYTTGKELASYRIDFTTIPTSYQYRAPMTTPKPKIVGSQAATITGPAGEEVYTNDYGDIKLQYHWDRYGPSNEQSSDWVRVIQGSAGQSFGSINTPRIGEEVLVDFINGDSDRPIVVGRLYNSANPPPWGFPAAAKQSGIKSKSFNSPLENFNELMFDDTMSSELVNFQAQKNLDSLVKNDETRHVMHDRTTTIDNDETVTVHGFRTETVDKDETITIHKNRTETVDMNESITIHKNRKERVDINETISIGGDRKESVSGNETINIGGNRTEQVNKNEKVTIQKNQAITINGKHSEHIKLDALQAIKLGKVLNIAKNYKIDVGKSMSTAVADNKKTNVGKKYHNVVGDEFKIVVGKASITLKSNGKIDIKGADITIHASGDQKTIAKGNITLKGKKILEN